MIMLIILIEYQLFRSMIYKGDKGTIWQLRKILCTVPLKLNT